MALRWAYFDTSALLKRYVREQGSPRVRSLLRRYRVLSAAILTVELASALSRRRSEGDASATDLAAIVSQIRRDRLYWSLVEVSPLVLARAEELVQGSPLRTLDAIHLASALTFEAVSGLRIPFVTGDSRQTAAAEGLGLHVIEVG